MKFNQYTWNLYKQSPDGQNAIKEFEDASENMSEIDLLCKYNPLMAEDIDKEVLSDIIETLWCYGVSEYQETKPISLEEAKVIYEELISFGIFAEGESYIDRGDFKSMLSANIELSILFYYLSPEYYFPNLFIFRFFDLNKIADAFEIELPAAPKKPDYKARCMYYWELCEVFFRFRMENNLLPAELCAFLYEFVPNFLPKEKPEIPKPSQAWCIGGLISQKDQNMNFSFWQSNKDTKKGDILIHYETSPISAITHLWIAQTDGVIDPFFHYYSNTYAGNKTPVPHITLKELQADEYFVKHPLIRKKFQGVNGWPMSSEDYTELLRMFKAKGFDTDTLPVLYAPALSKNIQISNERDVEIKLLEPLLGSMRWFENKDFVRQLPIHAGRGHRIFPDYERAKVLIEAKLYMKNNQDVEDTFKQARSYANILESSVIALCDRQCLIVYEKKDSFDRDRYTKYYWGELENPDRFNELKNKLTI